MFKSKSHASALSATAQTLHSNLSGNLSAGSPYALFGQDSSGTWSSEGSRHAPPGLMNPLGTQGRILEGNENTTDSDWALGEEIETTHHSPPSRNSHDAPLPPGTPPLQVQEDDPIVVQARETFESLSIQVEAPSHTGSQDRRNKQENLDTTKNQGMLVVVVSCRGKQWKVKHQFSEFETLHDIVTASKTIQKVPIFPGGRVATLPGNENPNMNSSSINQRDQLEPYLINLIQVPGVWKCQPVVQFIDNSENWLNVQRHVLSERERVRELESRIGDLQSECLQLRQRCEGQSRTIAKLQSSQTRGTSLLDQGYGIRTGGGGSVHDSPGSVGGFEIGIDDLDLASSPNALPLPPPSDWTTERNAATISNIRNIASQQQTQRMVTSFSTPHLGSGAHMLQASNGSKLLTWSIIPDVQQLSLVEQLSMHSTPRERLERHLNTIVAHVRPSWSSEMKRKRVFYFVLGLLKRSLGAQAYPLGPVPLRSYVPDEEIGVSVFVCNGQEGRWLVKVGEALMGSQSYEAETSADDMKQSQQHANGTTMDHNRCQVTSVNFSPTLHRIRCQIEGVMVDITANNLCALAQVAFFEEVDRVVGRDHLFKRSLLLLKAWAFYESRDETHENIMSIVPEPTLVTLLIHVFNVYHAKIQNTLQAISIFFMVVSQFDWSSRTLTVTGDHPTSQNSSPLPVWSNRQGRTGSGGIQQGQRNERFGSESQTNKKLGTQHGGFVNPSSDSTQHLIPRELIAKYAERYSRARQQTGDSQQMSQSKDSNDTRSARKFGEFQTSYLNISNPLDPLHNMGGWCTKQRQFQRFMRTFERGTGKITRVLLHLQREGDPDQRNANEAQLSIDAMSAMFSNTLQRFSSGWRPDIDQATLNMGDNIAFHDQTIPHEQVENGWTSVQQSVGSGLAPGSQNVATFPKSPKSGSQTMRRVFSVPVHLSDGQGNLSSGGHTSQDVLNGNLNEMWSRLRYCSLLLDSEVTGPALLSLATEILAEKGALPVGEIGKMLQEATASPNISSTLKEQFGGLKKFLEQHPDTFLISNDHPFNPKVYLLASLSESQVQSIQAGVVLGSGPASGKKRKSTRAKRVTTSPGTPAGSIQEQHGNMPSAQAGLNANVRVFYPQNSTPHAHNNLHGQGQSTVGYSGNQVNGYNSIGSNMSGRGGSSAQRQQQAVYGMQGATSSTGGMRHNLSHQSLSNSMDYGNTNRFQSHGEYGATNRFQEQHSAGLGHGHAIGVPRVGMNQTQVSHNALGYPTGLSSPQQPYGTHRMRSSASMVNLNFSNEF